MKDQNEERSSKLRILLVIGIVAAIIVAGWVTFTFFVPHTRVQITTTFKDSWSGKFVQTEVNNKGTHELEGLQISVAVWNGSKLLNSTSESPGDLAAHDNHTIHWLNFYGHSLDKFQVIVQVSFETNGKEYQETFDYETEPYQFQAWKDEIFEWG